MKTVLIGSSGAGKSGIALACSSSGIMSAEMDRELGVTVCPSLETALSWMRNNPADILTLGVHGNLILEMAIEKHCELWQRLFDDLRFIYLDHGRDKIAYQLTIPDSQGKIRPTGHLISTTQNFDWLHSLFLKIADEIINVGDHSVSEIVDYII